MGIIKIITGGVFCVVASFFTSIFIYVYYQKLKRKINLYLIAFKLYRSKDPEIKNIAKKLFKSLKK